MPMKAYKLLYIILLFVLDANATILNKPIVLYVSPSGDNKNQGTLKKPFASLERAKEAVKLLKKDGNKNEVNIVLLKGTYYLEEPLVFTSDESGFPGAPYIIKAERSAKVTLSGGVKLSLEWKHYNHKIWQADLSQIETIGSLYANGKALIRARYPNYQEGMYPYGGYSGDAISKERIVKWKDPKRGYIHAMHTGKWGGMHYQILKKTSDSTIQYEGGWQNNRPSPMHPTLRFVENIFEELDAPGEWFFDQDSQKLYYIPQENEDPKELTFIASNIESIIQLKGDEKRPVTDIRIEGITFQHTLPTFMKTEEQLMRSDWAIYRNGAVLFDGTERCEITNNTFSQLGGNAVFISNYNRNAKISSNLIENIGANAISFIGSSNAVRSPSFRYGQFVPLEEIDTIPGPKSNNYPSNSTAEDNLIRYIGLIEKQVAGVEIQMASKILVNHNTIYHVPRAGINIGDGAWGGHIIENNDVFSTVLETSDHGAFNSWGRDRFWHPERSKMDSIVGNHPELILLDAVEKTVIRNNRFRCDHGWDIDLDDGSSNYEIYNNLCLSGGLKLREGFYRTVYNNILLNNGFHPHVWFKNSHDVFKNNIVFMSHEPIEISYWGDSVDYNYFISKDDLMRSQGYGTDQNSLAGEPMFVNADNGNFDVSQFSPALNIGFKNFAMDIFGVTSPRLKEIADQPEIPKITSSRTIRKSEIFTWKGAKIKNIETLGEQSAAGLPEIKGVLIIESPQNSILGKAGLEKGDVIIQCGDERIHDIKSLLKAEVNDKWKGKLNLKVWRNQTSMNISLKNN